ARLHGRAYRCITEHHKNVDWQEREFIRQRRKTIHASFGAAIFHFEVTLLDVAEVAHPQQKLAAQVDCYRIRRPGRFELATPHDFRLLRARRERPHDRCTSKQRQEVAALHSITSSARTSRAVGIVRTSALAVLRLMNSSTFVACCTGRSAGCSPLRIRPVETPAWRDTSRMLLP